MSIRDFIERKKAEFFVAKDSDKRALQEKMLRDERDRLRQERAQIENVRTLQSEIRNERQRINGTDNLQNKFRGGFKNLSENVKRFDNRNDQPSSPFSTGPSGPRNVFDSPMSNNSPFATGGPSERKAPPPVQKKRPRTIVVKLE